MIAADASGTARTVLLHLAEGLRGRGFRVVPILPPDGGGWLGASLRRRGFRTRGFQVSSGWLVSPGRPDELSDALERLVG